jgi:hypothetical protein
MATGAPTAVLGIDDDHEHAYRSVAPTSAQKGMQLLDYDERNQSAASSSSKAKQSASRKSLHSLEPHPNQHNPAAGAEGSALAWKGEDTSALSKKSFTTTPSQQRHKRTLREGQRMQEDLLRVQSALEEQLIH